MLTFKLNHYVHTLAEANNRGVLWSPGNVLMRGAVYCSRLPCAEEGSLPADTYVSFSASKTLLAGTVPSECHRDVILTVCTADFGMGKRVALMTL